MRGKLVPTGLKAFAESKIRQLLDSIARLSVQSELLKPLSGKVLAINLPLSTGGTVSVIPAEICAAICTYYATESKAANDTARYSLAKFAAIGIDSWIRNVTGHAIALKAVPYFWSGFSFGYVPLNLLLILGRPGAPK